MPPVLSLASRETRRRKPMPHSQPATSPSPSRPEYAYRPPATSESAPHLQVLPDVARTWLPWVGGAVGGLAVLVLLVRWLRRR